VEGEVGVAADISKEYLKTAGNVKIKLEVEQWSN
jgi:hypothetical protein